MKEALIVLTLLGCDDSGAQCEWLTASTQRFATLEACRESSEEFLQAHQDAAYPTVAAVCSPRTELAERPIPPESPMEQEIEIAVSDEQGVPVEAEEDDPGVLSRIGSAVAGIIPERETVEKPIVLAADSVVKVGNSVIVGVSHAAKSVNPF